MSTVFPYRVIFSKSEEKPNVRGNPNTWDSITLTHLAWHFHAESFDNDQTIMCFQIWAETREDIFGMHEVKAMCKWAELENGKHAAAVKIPASITGAAKRSSSFAFEKHFTLPDLKQCSCMPTCLIGSRHPVNGCTLWANHCEDMQMFCSIYTICLLQRNDLNSSWGHHQWTLLSFCTLGRWVTVWKTSNNQTLAHKERKFAPTVYDP